LNNKKALPDDVLFLPVVKALINLPQWQEKERGYADLPTQ
jgi:hypothetical protein